MGAARPGSGAVEKKAVLDGGTEGSNPSPSSAESCANPTSSERLRNYVEFEPKSGKPTYHKGGFLYVMNDSGKSVH